MPRTVKDLIDRYDAATKRKADSALALSRAQSEDSAASDELAAAHAAALQGMAPNRVYSHPSTESPLWLRVGDQVTPIKPVDCSQEAVPDAAPDANPNAALVATVAPAS